MLTGGRRRRDRPAEIATPKRLLADRAGDADNLRDGPRAQRITAVLASGKARAAP